MNVTQYTGLNGKRYRLTDHIKGGGEGGVSHIEGNDVSVAKIFNNKKTLEEKTELEEKLKLMVEMHVDPRLDGALALAWPEDVLYDSDGRFAGYVMPYIPDCRTMIVACRPNERVSMLYGEDYTWKKSIATAYNLALLVECVHRADMVVGDMNSGNALVNSHAQVTLVDCDSFQIRSPKTGKLYKCTVGVSEMQAPEIQGRDMRKPGNDYTVYTDRFALAIHIFMLLCNGYHPFNVVKNESGDSVVGTQDVQSANISRGYCPFVRKHTKSDLPEGAPNMKMLPDYIMDLFRRAFGYTASNAVLEKTLRKRPSAEEWRKALQRLFDECTQQCSREEQHVYWQGYVKCPWCEIKGINSYQRSAFPFFLVCILVSMICSPLVLECINYLFQCGYNMNILMQHGAIMGICCGLAIAVCLRDEYLKASRPGRLYWFSLVAPVYSLFYFLV